MAATINPNQTLARQQEETRARNDRPLWQRIAERLVAQEKEQPQRTHS